jgi:hypothetical protein
LIEKDFQQEWETKALEKLIPVVIKYKLNGTPDINNWKEFQDQIPYSYNFKKTRSILSRIYKNKDDQDSSISNGLSLLSTYLDKPKVWALLQELSKNYQNGILNISSILNKRRLPKIKPILFERDRTIPGLLSNRPLINQLDKQQLKFFLYLTRNFKKNNFPEINGYIGYLFLYVAELLKKGKIKGYQWVFNKLVDLLEHYYQEKRFRDSCIRWCLDCLLASKQYEKFLEVSSSENTNKDDWPEYWKERHDLRIIVNRICEKHQDAPDLVNIAFLTLNPYSKE